MNRNEVDDIVQGVARIVGATAADAFNSAAFWLGRFASPRGDKSFDDVQREETWMLNWWETCTVRAGRMDAVGFAQKID